MAQENILSLSLSEYRKQISELKNELTTLTRGSEEYNAKCREIQSMQSKVTQAMKDAKQGGVALDGSYNQLVATMSELKEQWKATSDEAERANLGKQINDINTQLKDLDASTGNFQRNVGDYANQFANAFKGLGVSLGGAERAFALASTAGMSFKGVLTMISTHPIIAVVTVLVGIFMKLKDAIANNETTSRKWSKAMSAFKPIINAITNAIDWLAGILADVVLWISEAIPKVLDWVGGFSKSFFNILGGIVDAITFIPRKIGDAMKAVVNIVTEALTKVGGVVDEVLNAVGVDSNIAGSIGKIGNFIEGVIGKYTSFLNGAGDAVRAFGDKVDGFMKNLSTAMVTAQKTEEKRQKLEDDIREGEVKTAESEKKQAELRLQIAQATGKKRLELERQLQKEIITNGKRQEQLAKRQYDMAKYYASLTPNSKEDNERLNQLLVNTKRAEANTIQSQVKVQQKITKGEQELTKAVEKEAEKRAKAMVDAEKKKTEAQRKEEQKRKQALADYVKEENEIINGAKTQTSDSLKDLKEEENFLKTIGNLTAEKQKEIENERYKITKDGIENELKLQQEKLKELEKYGELSKDEQMKTENIINSLIIQSFRENLIHKTNEEKIYLEERKKLYEKDLKERQQLETRGTAENSLKENIEKVDLAEQYTNGLINYDEYQKQLTERQEYWENIKLQRQIESDQAQVDELQRFYDELLLKYGENNQNVIEAKQKLDEALLKKSQDTNTKELKDAENNAKKKKKLDDDETKYKQKKLKAYEAFSSGMQSLLGENTKTAKALAITDAVVSTWQGASAILAEGPKAYGGGPWGLAAMIGAMTGEIATGMANVKNIISEKQSDSASASSSVSAISNASVTPLLDETQDLLNMTNISLSNGENQRVYVVESDITDAQNKVRVSENNSTF